MIFHLEKAFKTDPGLFYLQRTASTQVFQEKAVKRLNEE